MGIMIFDTSYLIEHPDAINRLTGNLVVPAIVLKQLDGLKNSEKEDVAHKARAASNAIIEAQRSGRLTISVDYNKVDMLDNNADNVIMGTAAKLKETYPEVILMTTDVNMRIAAESMEIFSGRVIKDGWLAMRCSIGAIAYLAIIFVSFIIPKLFKYVGWAEELGAILIATLLIVGIPVCAFLESKIVHYKKVDDLSIFMDSACCNIPGNVFYRVKHHD